MLSSMGQRPLYYTLRGTTPVPTDNIHEVEQLLTSIARRRVGYDRLSGGVEVSTVFLVIDHGWLNMGPRVFETMVFGGPGEGIIQRYATWNEAEQGHRDVVRSLRARRVQRRWRIGRILERVAPAVNEEA